MFLYGSVTHRFSVITLNFDSQVILDTAPYLKFHNECNVTCRKNTAAVSIHTSRPGLPELLQGLIYSLCQKKF